MTRSTLLAALLAALAPAAFAQSDSADLAKQLSNPVASLISVPFQYNYNDGFGLDGDGHQSYVNIQPVIPFSISPNWNVISRTILPVVWQDGVVPDVGSQFGLGNTTQSFFFSPKQPTSFGLIWGVGPAFQASSPTSGAPASPASPCDNRAAGPTGHSPITSGRSPATAGTATSPRPSCSRSSATRRRRRRPSRSIPSPPTTGRTTSGRCRST